MKRSLDESHTQTHGNLIYVGNQRCLSRSEESKCKCTRSNDSTKDNTFRLKITSKWNIKDCHLFEDQIQLSHEHVLLTTAYQFLYEVILGIMWKRKAQKYRYNEDRSEERITHVNEQ